MNSEEILQNIYYDETSLTCLRWKITQVLPDGRRTRCIKDAVVGCLNAKCFYFKHKRYSIAIVVLLLNGITFSSDKHFIRYLDGDKNNHKISNLLCDNRKDVELKQKSKSYRERVKSNKKNENERRLLNSARERSRRFGITCSLTLEDIIIPKFCPILGLKLEKGIGKSTRSSPSLDRIIPTNGYTKDNIQVISMQANTMKSNATIEELLKFANWILNEYN